ncbi:hypothetical protein [Coleofasciculus sp. FACHB-1120]|uniref:hypothetical protein n=1 Tax=Coleofasciculus sp. FACHB-1120 TaxID=2692783 RepID=UPI0016898ED1|nr:hypothetical protein [Coleofasciculus sp. FACHB-1120]MBD2741400.1 hypothetical protein [Coleofasciculus sp. FACHB-1120]
MALPNQRPNDPPQSPTTRHLHLVSASTPPPSEKPDAIASQQQRVNARNRSTSSTVWSIYTLISVIVHVLGMWMLQRLIMGTAIVDVGTEPIPVDLITTVPNAEDRLEPQAAPPQQRQERDRNFNVSGGNPVQQPIPAQIPQENSPVNSQPRIQRSFRIRLNPFPQAQNPTANSPSTPQRQQPNSDVVATRPSIPTPAQRPPLVPQQPPETGRPLGSSSQDAGTPAPAPPSQPQPSSSQPVEPAPAPVTPPPAPPVQASQAPAPIPPAPPAEEPQSAPSPAPAAPAAQGKGVVATLFNVRSGNAGADEPNQLAVPQQAQKQIPDLDYPLLTGQAPDEPIVLEVLLLIDNTGKPSVQRVLQGSGSLADSQFVNELIQGWRFQPAYMGGGAVDSLLEVSIRVSPLSQ